MCVPGCQEAVRDSLSRRGFFKSAAAAGFAASAVAAPAEAAPRSFRAVIDLTHTMSPDFPTFFGVPGVELQKQFDVKKDGFNLNWWRIIEHAGTHIDAPLHFSESGISVDRIAAGQLVTPFPNLRMRTGYCYFLIENRERADLAHVAAFRSWLNEEVRRGPSRAT